MLAILTFRRLQLHMAASKNYYQEIDVSQNASTEEIINAVKQLVKANQPDNFSDAKERENAQQHLRLIKRAYETLKDENLRLEYDLSLVNDSQPKSSNTQSKTRSFKFISSLILGTVAVTAGATVYLSNLDCSNQRNVVDATICEKTKPIREIFGSTETAAPVVVTAESAHQTPSEKPVETASAPAATKEPTPVSKEPDVKNTEPVNVQVNVATDNSVNNTIPVAATVSQTQIQPAVTFQQSQPVVQQPINTGSAPAIQTVIVEGVGTTPQDAAQNAAQNALTNVVGTFIDANTMLQKRTLITDGIKSETKNISKDIKDYSQGSIKSFELLDTQQQNGLFRVNAKVTVRNENFSAYIKQIAQGEVKVESALFAEMATEAKQKDNLADILKDNVILPIMSGEAQEFIVEKPMLLTQLSKIEKFQDLSNALKSEFGNGILSDPNFIIFKVTAQLKNGFIDNLNKTLKETAINHTVVKANKIIYTDHNRVSEWSVLKASNPTDTQYNFYDFFEFNVSKDELIKKIADKCSKNCLSQTLQVTVNNSENKTLIIKNLTNEHRIRNHPSNYSIWSDDGIIVVGQENILINDHSLSASPQWGLLKAVSQHPSVIVERDGFYVLLKLSTEIMKDAGKIVVSLEK